MKGDRRINEGKEYAAMITEVSHMEDLFVDPAAHMKLAVQSSVLVACALVISGCSRHAPAPPLVRPVQTTVIRYGTAGEPVSLSGQVQAQKQTNLALPIRRRPPPPPPAGGPAPPPPPPPAAPRTP